jgi:hypothetical protein
MDWASLRGHAGCPPGLTGAPLSAATVYASPTGSAAAVIRHG